MFYDETLYHFHTSTRPKYLLGDEKLLRTIYTFQRQTGGTPSLADIVRRCHYFAKPKYVKHLLSSLMADEKIGWERHGRTWRYWVEYEGLQTLTRIMNEYNEEHGE